MYRRHKGLRYGLAVAERLSRKRLQRNRPCLIVHFLPWIPPKCHNPNARIGWNAGYFVWSPFLGNIVVAEIARFVQIIVASMQHRGCRQRSNFGHPHGRLVALRRRPARSRAQQRGAVLHLRPPSRWTGPVTSLPTNADRLGVERRDQSRQGLRSDPRPSGRGLPRDGRETRD